MKRYTLLLLLPLLAVQTSTAQFGTVPTLIDQSTNGNLLEISAADIDQDGDLDVLNTHSNSLVWYENLDGNGSFSIGRELIALNLRNSVGFYGAQFFDFDEDSLPDLAADLYWRKNLGNGQYAPAVSVFTASLGTLADLDGDGRKDAVILDSGKIYWQKNLGNGAFAARQTIRNASNTSVFAATGDFDYDGRHDFFANWNNRCVWFKNQGNAAFDTVHLSTVNASAILAQDFNNNGKTDLLLAVENSIYWYEFDSSGQRQLIQTLPNYRSSQLALGDLNRDGFIDLFAGNTQTSIATRARYYAFDPATGLFDPAPKNHNIYLIQHAYAKWADLDSDGNGDLLIGSTSGTGWLRSQAPGMFSGSVNITRLLSLPKQIISADHENDGDEDLYTGGYVFENLGNGQFAERRSATAPGSKHFSGDLDGDGLKDIALPSGDSIAWRRALGNGQFAAPVRLPGLVTSCKQVAGADLDNDGDLDLFAANGTDAVAPNARFYWFENDGKGQFTGHLVETGIQLCSGAFPLDPNEDGLPDMWLTFFNNNPARLYENQGGGQFVLKPAFSSSLPNPQRVNQFMLTDLDADGRLDYIYTTLDWSYTKCAWFRNLGSGFAPETVLLTINQNASYGTPYFTVFDANLDGLPDVVISDNYWTKLTYLRGLGNGAFAPPALIHDDPNTYGHFFAVTPSDVDGDGKLDIVFGKRTKDVGGYNQLYWLANEYPTPPPHIRVLHQSVGCEDNGTPADATDDIRVLRMHIANPGGLSDRYYLTNPLDSLPLDTFWYNQIQVLRFPPGSAGDGIQRAKVIHDLLDPALSEWIFADPVPHCSSEVPATIDIFQLDSWCYSSETPNDPSDDRVVFYFTAQLSNAQQPSPGFHLASNLGTVTQQGTGIQNEGSYNTQQIYFLPPGSAGQPGPVVLTLRDKADTTIVQTLTFDNPGVCSTSGTSAPGQNSLLRITPNPSLSGAPLLISLENAFLGTIKIDVLDLDGRLLHTFSREKTGAVFTESVAVPAHWPGRFLVRVSDGTHTATHLILKF